MDADRPGDRGRWFLPPGAGLSGAAGAWDEGCEVTSYVDGLAAMSAMRDALEAAVAEAGEAAAAGLPPGRRGHVYLAAWRLNGLRDLSDDGGWPAGGAGGGGRPPRRDATDQTVLGLLLRLLQAGVRLRLLLWLPTWLARGADYGPHIDDHLYLARVVAAESRRLGPDAGGGPLGVAALDLRVAARAGLTASHHGKLLVVRGHRTSVAFCGGIDLAYTRRADPPAAGDPQSGEAIPDPAAGWPRAAGVDYASVDAAGPAPARQHSDLPEPVYGDGRRPATRQLWHDHHLRLRGPAVATVEAAIGERWAAPGRATDLAKVARGCWRAGQVVVSAPEAVDPSGRLSPLPRPVPVAPAGRSGVQVWRTVPAAPGRPAGERVFTVLAGTARACAQARELIWIVDQYFWSRPLARLLNRRLAAVPGLCVLLVLPPHADTKASLQHRARALALRDLVEGLDPAARERVAVYDLWCAGPPQRGVYVHAKTQLYDGSLLVCGSANRNRRSFTCDTELDCAVLDPAVTARHQRMLWDRMLQGAPWPDLDLERPGSGRRFLAALRAAVATGPSLLVPDPWEAPAPRLPDGTARRDRPPPGIFGPLYRAVLDPTSLPRGLEREVAGANGRPHPPDLGELAARLMGRDATNTVDQ